MSSAFCTTPAPSPGDALARHPLQNAICTSVAGQLTLQGESGRANGIGASVDRQAVKRCHCRALAPSVSRERYVHNLGYLLTQSRRLSAGRRRLLGPHTPCIGRLRPSLTSPNFSSTGLGKPLHLPSASHSVRPRSEYITLSRAGDINPRTHPAVARSGVPVSPPPRASWATNSSHPCTREMTDVQVG